MVVGISRAGPAVAVILTVLASGAGPAQGKCAVGGRTNLLPEPRTTLPTNGRIIVEGYLEDGERVSSIARSRPALVAEDGDRVSLNTVAVHRGALNVVQAVLAPSRPLRPQTRYTLHLDGAPAGSSHGIATWTSGSDGDTEKPRWSAPPTLDRTSYRGLGCGPEVNAFLQVAVTDEGMGGGSPLFLAELAEDGNGAVARYIVEVRQDGLLAIGHGMCSGPFSLRMGVPYSLTLTAVDFAGNAAPAPGPPIRFTGPNENRSEFVREVRIGSDSEPPSFVILGWPETQEPGAPHGEEVRQILLSRKPELERCLKRAALKWPEDGYRLGGSMELLVGPAGADKVVSVQADSVVAQAMARCARRGFVTPSRERVDRPRWRVRLPFRIEAPRKE